jgi:hypothetical protein|uniref:Uncharacterized protein n=1 Tax=Haptolina ericina TaxID=156174 RepID=A0A7S3F2G9_9EUKA|mmetsp:Transcript_49238/g.110750  ORF Transcript_49238/g.110750 Transcript_49238/m.110750 type:complete len:109 (+) Transcript_49238:659-985(+)
MNVAMSTATELTHKANGNAELATASAMTRDRSRAILAALLAQGMPGLSDEVEKLFTAVQPWTVAEAPDAPLKPAADADEGWVKFTRKWGYNAEQREAIRVQVAEILIR